MLAGVSAGVSAQPFGLPSRALQSRVPASAVRVRRRPGRSKRKKGPDEGRLPAVSPENKEVLRELRSREDAPQKEVQVLVESLIQEASLTRSREYALFIGEMGRRNLWRESLMLLADREARSSNLDVQVYNSAMAACAKAGRWDCSLQILGHMWDKDVTPDMVSYNIAMAATVEAREWKLTLEILDDMQRCRRRDFMSFNASIGACVQGRQWERAIDLIDEMVYWDVTPDWRMYNLGIILSGDGDQWQTALGMLENMWQQLVIPDAVSYSATISVCEKAGQWESALWLLGIMGRKGIPRDPSTLALVEHACRTAGQTASADRIARDAALASVPVSAQVQGPEDGSRAP